MYQSPQRGSSINQLVFGGDSDQATPRSSYSDFASHAKLTPQSSTSSMAYTHQNKYKKTDIFSLESLDAVAPRKHVYYNKSTVFDNDSMPPSGKTRKDPMASNIFFSDAAPAAEPRYVPSQGETRRQVEEPRVEYHQEVEKSQFEKPTESYDKPTESYERQAYEKPTESYERPSQVESYDRPAYEKPTGNHHYNSSVFEAEVAAVPRARRHFGHQSSDIFHRDGEESRHSTSSQSSSAQVSQVWTPRQDYTRSSSFSNIFGDNGSQSSESLKVAPEMDRAGGLTTEQLSRQHRGRGRHSGSQGVGSQIWF